MIVLLESLEDFSWFQLPIYFSVEFLISRTLVSEVNCWLDPTFWEQMVTLLGSTLMSDCVRRSGIVR